jgi:hypothetical protein
MVIPKTFLSFRFEKRPEPLKTGFGLFLAETDFVVILFFAI